MPNIDTNMADSDGETVMSSPLPDLAESNYSTEERSSPLAFDANSHDSPNSGQSSLVSDQSGSAVHLAFSSFRDAQNRLTSAYWTPPAEGVPKTEEEEKICIRQLIRAFKRTDKALDSPRSAYRYRFMTNYYDAESIEFCAWKILDLLQQLHSGGFRPHIYDSEMNKSASATREFTFTRRLNDICEVLEVSKFAAVQALKGEKMTTLIATPDKLYNSVLANASSNAKRSDWIVEGRKADEKHQPKLKRRKTHDDSASSSPLPASPIQAATTTFPSPTPPIAAPHAPVAVVPKKKKRARMMNKDKSLFCTAPPTPPGKAVPAAAAAATTANPSTESPANTTEADILSATRGTPALSSNADSPTEPPVPLPVNFIANPDDLPIRGVVVDRDAADAVEALCLMRSSRFLQGVDETDGRWVGVARS